MIVNLRYYNTLSHSSACTIISMSQGRFFVIALLFSCYLGRTFVCEAEVYVIDIQSFEPASTCSSSPKGSARGVQIAHTYGPCSPLTQENSTPRNSSQIFMQDQSRVRSINSLTSSKHPSTNDQGKQAEAMLPVVNHHIGGGNFVVTVGFGTPKRDFTLIFDTGSEVTWVKCKPCSGNCHSKNDPSYNPYISSTFSNGTGTSNSSSSFSVTYTDNSNSRGYFVRDTLTLTSSDVFPNFVFGCSQEYSTGDFGQAAGLLGVGQNSPLSLVSQTYTKFEKIFCYCLPAANRSTGYLLFGQEALETCQTEKFTPLSSQSGGSESSDYFVNLIGITIGKQRLKVSPHVLSTPTGSILDSGTVITRLPPSVYSALQSAFQKSMSQYPRAQKLPPLLDTCYNLKNYKNVTIPSMALHFANSVDVNLDPQAVLWRESDSQVCLAFAANKNERDLIIIGNHQQLMLNVLYNIPKGKVGFGTGGCG